ncbi:hypothetical protein [Bradyrhizobium sp. WSM1743]|uniref:hypothetical protein n=1 Tax=Bradyrhizobium sp. WSM1743 TaxID=318996 RepID=UPI000568D0AA|nr:hypothetical protein [Bradyrhizobium sp. WSM1743]
MKVMQARLEKLKRDAAECALIRDLATDPKKRELFARLADHLDVLASAVEQAMGESGGSEISPDLPPRPSRRA